MSYIINNSDAYVNTKLTELGRQKLAKGSLNFSFWAIGDSEINYDREAIVDANPTDVTLSGITKILRPRDKQHNIKSWIHTGGTGTVSVLQPMTSANIKTLKVVVNNEATERGFFSGSSAAGWTTLTGSPYTISSGQITDDVISGGTSLVIGSATTRNVGDFILLKLANETIGGVALNTNVEPIPHLWYKIQTSSADTITVDRNLPNLAATGGTAIQFIVYAGGEVADTIGSATTSYWDSGTLSFDSANDISCSDVPVWNMNNVWCEDLAGITGATYEGAEYFGSYQYLGQKNPLFEYDCSGTGVTSQLKCEGLSELDSSNKSIAIIHYTNNAISNFYGEFFHIDNSNDKTVSIHIPDLMYHRRTFSGGTGDTMGMSFVASGSVKTVGTSNLEYVDLYEAAAFVDGTPITVGKVFPSLKVLTFDDEEIVSALSYKSNRNWTLPPLAATLANPSGGTSTGLLVQNETMYLTYSLENSTGTGLTNSIACQKYAKITNQTAVAKDVEFRLDGTGLLPYMRKIEDGGYDGRGFYGYELKVMYQVQPDDETRPDPTAWKVYDFTTTGLTSSTGETISPSQLENQSPITNGFVLDLIKDSGTTIYDITQSMGMAPVTTPEVLQFGDERFFYGNLETYIGATIFKTMFDIRINSGQFIGTTNETRSKDTSTNPPDIRVSEVGIYDSDNDLVVIGKLSKPIKLESGNTVMIELSMDF